MRRIFPTMTHPFADSYGTVYLIPSGQERIVRQLMRHFGAASAVMCFISLLFVNASAQQQIVVGPNVLVSKTNSDREHNEVILAAHPNDPRHLLAASMVFNQAKSNYNVIAYVSVDGGLTWKPTLELNEEEGHNSDPTVAFGCDGTVYLGSLSIKRTKTYVTKTLLHRSKDGGNTWLEPTALGPRDREYLIADCSYRSNETGGLYMYSAAGRVLYSEDQGQAFQEVKLPSPPNRQLNVSGTAVILSDGTFVVAYPELPSLESIGGDHSKVYEQGESPIRAFRFTAGGKSFTGPYTISKATRPREADKGFPNLAVDLSSSPFRDRIYAVWVDGTSGSIDRTSGRSQIMFAYSTDKGEKWSDPIVLNDDQTLDNGPKGPNTFMAEVVVNRDGVVGVTWYDRRDSRNDLDWTVRFTASFDGGESFLPSVKVSDAVFTHDLTKSPPFRLHAPAGGRDVLTFSASPHPFWLNGGDTAGLAADAAGIFHPLWVDNRMGIAQVWTSAVNVNGKAVRNGVPELQDLEDITRHMTVRFGNTQYDPKARKVSGLLYLHNTSDKTVTGPVVIRVLGFRRGQLQILNPDNDMPGPGAIWTYTSALRENKLEPGAKGSGKHIEFRVPSIKDLAGAQPGIRAKVLGKVGHASASRN